VDGVGQVVRRQRRATVFLPRLPVSSSISWIFPSWYAVPDSPEDPGEGPSGTQKAHYGPEWADMVKKP
jgi:hypothetical protein